MYPSEYAYKNNSVFGSERSSANCRLYASGLDNDKRGIYTEHYTHCDGRQFRLTDSDFGSEQYRSNDYYAWNAGSSAYQLLFILPTSRVNLTTITLHYYSDNTRGLPRLRFYNVSDNFDVWNQPVASYSRVDIAAVPSGEEPAGLRNVSVNFEFMNVKKVLLYKFSSSYIFAASEVEFFTCNSKLTKQTYITMLNNDSYLYLYLQQIAWENQLKAALQQYNQRQHFPPSVHQVSTLVVVTHISILQKIFF